jgi:hypothetical protein
MLPMPIPANVHEATVEHNVVHVKEVLHGGHWACSDRGSTVVLHLQVLL